MESLALLAVLGIAAASLKVWIEIAVRWRRRLPLAPYEPHRRAPWSALDLFIIVVAYIAANLVLAFLQFREHGTQAPAEWNVRDVASALASTALANLATVAFAIVWIRQRTGAAWSDLGLRFDRAWADIRLGLATFAAISVPIYVMQLLLSQFVHEEHPIITLLRQHQQPWVLALCVVSAVIVAPVAEEFFFRVLLQGWLESLETPFADEEGPGNAGSSMQADLPGESESPSGQRPALVRTAEVDNPYAASPSLAASPGAFGPQQERASKAPGSFGGMSWNSVSILISSLVFSLMHLGHGADPIPLFFLAVALGYLYQRTGRLLPSVVVHFCLNACSLFALWYSLAFGVE